MILGGDLNAPGLEILDGMVGAAVSEGKLEGLQADGTAEQLVPEADAPDGLAPDDLAHGVDDVAERGGIAGAVCEEDRVGILGEQLCGGAGAGMQGDTGAAGDELSDHRCLDTGVDDGDPRTGAIAVMGDRAR